MTRLRLSERASYGEASPPLRSSNAESYGEAGMRTPYLCTSAPQRCNRGLIVDLDDTLYPREQFVQSGFVAVARHVEARHGLRATDALATLWQSRRGATLGSEFQVLCERHDLSGSLVADLVDVFRRHVPSLRLPRGTEAVLSKMRAGGWRVVVLTNGLPSVQRSKVAALGLASLVDAVVYAEEHSPGGKPAMPTFLEALARLDVRAGRCVCVGDDPVCDIAGARAAGIRTIHLATAAHSHDRVQADAVIDCLDELPAVAGALLKTVTTDAA